MVELPQRADHGVLLLGRRRGEVFINESRENQDGFETAARLKGVLAITKCKTYITRQKQQPLMASKKAIMPSEDHIGNVDVSNRFV